ncbi:MAG: hypothetical protein ACUVRD_02845 [Bacteroidia bacterium]
MGGYLATLGLLGCRSLDDDKAFLPTRVGTALLCKDSLFLALADDRIFLLETDVTACEAQGEKLWFSKGKNLYSTASPGWEKTYVLSLPDTAYDLRLFDETLWIGGKNFLFRLQDNQTKTFSLPITARWVFPTTQWIYVLDTTEVGIFHPVAFSFVRDTLPGQLIDVGYTALRLSIQGTYLQGEVHAFEASMYEPQWRYALPSTYLAYRPSPFAKKYYGHEVLTAFTWRKDSILMPLGQKVSSFGIDFQGGGVYYTWQDTLHVTYGEAEKKYFFPRVLRRVVFLYAP